MAVGCLVVRRTRLPLRSHLPSISLPERPAGAVGTHSRLASGARRGFAEAAKAPAKQLRLNFYVPHAVIAQDEVVKQVTIPAVDGAFGVLAGHVPTVSEMKPGVVQVEDENGKLRNYFVSGGFAFVHNNSTTDISAVEAVPVEDIDEEAVRSGYQKATRELSEAREEKEKAIAQIRIDVHQAMATAINIKLE